MPLVDDQITAIDALIARIEQKPITQRLTHRRGVSRTSDFERIKNLPRREWEADPDLPFITKALTELLRSPNGTMDLWPIQAAALRDIHDFRGAFLIVGVGRGKTPISLLAPVLVEAKRPILIVPADLREQTIHKAIPEMRKHWVLHKNLKIIGYSELSLAKNADMLERYQPDMIIMDECHSVARPSAGRTKRLVRYMREHPQTTVVAMSGTVSNRSIRDYWHIIRWCLKDALTPLPLKWQLMAEWSDAIDEGVREDARMGPGVLLEFCEPEDMGNVRKGFRRRLTQTPGVVATGVEELGTSLIIRKHRVAGMDDKTFELMRHVRDTWDDPNGDPITEAVDLWRIMRQLSLGFWYRWWNQKGFNECLLRILKQNVSSVNSSSKKSDLRRDESAIGNATTQISGGLIIRPIEQQILKRCAHMTVKDSEMVSALATLRSEGITGTSESLGTDTTSRSKTIKNYSINSRELAIFVERIGGSRYLKAVVTGVGSTSTMTTRPGKLEGFCAPRATEHSVSWEMILRAYPALLPILERAVKAAGPNDEWLAARKAWKQYVREVLKHNRRNLDTELQVWNECERERPTPEWVDWRGIKDTFKINTVAEWVSDFAIRDVCEWMDKGPGIVWTEHAAFAERLSEVSGVPYFGPGKRASREILDASGVIIASIRAHGQGKNLQQWNRNLVTAPPSSGKTWEQVLGRTHREGQKSDAVIFDVMLHAPELIAAFNQAQADAVYLEDSLGSRQRLNYGDIIGFAQ